MNRSYSLYLSLFLVLWAVSCTKVDVPFPSPELPECNADVFISSQNVLNNFSRTEILGDLVISGGNITNLSGLASLERICGDLKIADCPNLTNLESLPFSLVIEGDLIIESNAQLTTLEGLSDELVVGRDMIISFNTQLTDLLGLSYATLIKRRLRISGNPNLKNLHGIPSSLSVASLEIISNESLEDLTGVPIDIGKLTLHDLPALTDLGGIPPGFYISELRVSQCEKLESLRGFSPGSTFLIDLIIEDNPLLNDVSQLENLIFVRRELSIMGNPELNTCCSLYDLVDGRGIIPVTIQVKNNGEEGGCRSHSEILQFRSC